MKLKIIFKNSVIEIYEKFFEDKRRFYVMNNCVVFLGVLYVN